METLCKLYLELANVVPDDCLSARDLAAKAKLDDYGRALLFVANGVASPADVARAALRKYGLLQKFEDNSEAALAEGASNFISKHEVQSPNR